ncbi:MAG: aminotransferase DegT [Bdellovibrionales bacterium RIFOXYC1_FULL_54_43]|nr:MAG: aminotransferase DegT [Bdellovibrionales bacterium RIFOXYC1_FULL_54_43]OFZ83943.1 MAG: aminotransferase DegT [Bdellovibrionales bacterium RIFOXYD1_FULL_55_31]
MTQSLAQELTQFVRSHYGTESGAIPLHAPVFQGNEKKYLAECIDSTFVSYLGKYVTQLEAMTQEYTGTKHAIAIGNGTLALHAALHVLGANSESEVITQTLTFVATVNAIRYTGAAPVFLDSSRTTLGMCPEALKVFLQENAELRDGKAYNRKTGKSFAACVPMHVFGHCVDLDGLIKICDSYGIPLLEDAAESLGSFYKGRHTGVIGKLGILSYNGNKIVTTGGGGMILTNDDALAARLRHITTTAKKKHAWAFEHDELGFNYRMPNVNAAVGCAQMERLPQMLADKRATAEAYARFFAQKGIPFIAEPEGTKSNYWLNAILAGSRQERDAILEYTNSHGVMTRPVWEPMHRLPMHADFQRGPLTNAEWLADRLVNIPSGVRP